MTYSSFIAERLSNTGFLPFRSEINVKHYVKALAMWEWVICRGEVCLVTSYGRENLFVEAPWVSAGIGSARYNSVKGYVTYTSLSLVPFLNPCLDIAVEFMLAKWGFQCFLSF